MLGVAQAVPLISAVAQRNIKITVRPEMEIAAVMVGGEIELIDKDDLGIWVGVVGIVGAGLKAGKPLVQPAGEEVRLRSRTLSKKQKSNGLSHNPDEKPVPKGRVHQEACRP